MTEQPASNDFGLPSGESFPVWQLARHWGVDRKHVVNLVESGAIKAFDLRGEGKSRSTYRIARASVVAFLESRKVIVAPARSELDHLDEECAAGRLCRSEHARKN